MLCNTVNRSVYKKDIMLIFNERWLLSLHFDDLCRCIGMLLPSLVTLTGYTSKHPERLSIIPHSLLSPARRTSFSASILFRTLCQYTPESRCIRSPP
jgi:hypothetical protein